MREGRQARVTISVALATFNGGRFLSRQLDSLLAQAVMPDEIVVSDDGSSDATRTILANFRAPAGVRVVTLLNTERLGYADNFLQAAFRCSGDYVAFCDQDDEWHPAKIARIRHALSADPVDLLVHDADVIDEGGRQIGAHLHGLRDGLYDAGELPPWGVFFGFTCTVKRSLLSLMPPATRPPDDIDPRVRLSHDRWIYFLANSFGRTRVTSERLVRYRQHSGNVFGSRHASGWSKAVKFWTGYREYLAKHEFLAQARLHALRAARDESGDPTRFRRPIEVWDRQARLFRLRQEMLTGRALRTRVAAAREVFATGSGRDAPAAAMDLAAFLLRR